MSASAICRRRRRALAGALGALLLALGPVPPAAIAQTPPAPGADQPQAQPKPAEQTQPKPAEQTQPKPAEQAQPKPREQAPSKPPEQAEHKPVPSAEPVVTNNAEAVLGKKVVGSKGENLGLVVDVLVDKSGEPQAAVIDFGGFLGVGSRKVAIDWKLLDFSQLEQNGTVVLGLDRAQISAAPEYKPGKPGPSVVTTPPAPDATQKNP
jgi:hypothetical protein